MLDPARLHAKKGMTLPELQAELSQMSLEELEALERILTILDNGSSRASRPGAQAHPRTDGPTLLTAKEEQQREDYLKRLTRLSFALGFMTLVAVCFLC